MAADFDFSDDSILVVPDDCQGLRAAEVLARFWPELRRTAIRQVVREGKVERNGTPLRLHDKLRPGDVIFCRDFDPESLPVHRERDAFQKPVVHHEDAACMVIAKPAGLATTPDRMGQDSVHERLGEWFGQDADLRIVHRLDKGTSGALILAKGLEASRAFDQMFREREMDKEYLALCRGRAPRDDEFSCDTQIGRTLRGGRVKIGVSKGSREAHTDFRVLQRFQGYCLISARPKTGRMHQIRAHLSWLHMPLAVDPLYRGGKELKLSEFKHGYRPHRSRPERPLIDRLTLHALRLGFSSPDGGRDVRVEVEVPKDLRTVIQKLERYAALDEASEAWSKQNNGERA